MNIKLRKLQVLYDDKPHHGTSPHHCRSCWEQPNKIHCPPCCLVAGAQLWRKRIRIYHLFLIVQSYPPVLDQAILLCLLPEGQLIFLPLTLPPVQKNLWPSLLTRPRNSLSLAELSILTSLIPFARQNDSPPPWVKEEQPSLQLIK